MNEELYPGHEEEAVRRSRSKRLRLGLIAVGLVAALTLSACVPLMRLVESALAGGSGGSSAEPSGSISVPEVIGTNFGAQEPTWVSCGDGMQCTKVAAPLDWQNPAGERIELALVKHAASGGEKLGTLFVNPGGPGSSGVDYVMQSIDYAVGEPLQRAYDIIGWDPRGVGASSAVACLDDVEMDDYLYGKSDLDSLTVGSDEWIDAAVAESAQFGQACLESTGPLLGHVDTDSTVQDLDMLRQIVDDDGLNYLGYSYGTYIGARYAEAYPERVGRLVLDGAIDPTTTQAEVVREQTRGFELALGTYMKDCLGRDDCPFTGTVEQGLNSWTELLRAVEEQPLVGEDGRIVDSGTLLTAIITPLYSQQSWPYLDSLYLSTVHGSAEAALALADFYNDRVGGTYTSNLITAFSAINCLDYPRFLPLDAERMREEAAELQKIAPTIGEFQGYGDVFCAGWPVQGAAERAAVRAEGAAPILVVGTTGDPATPFRWAESLAEQLESGVLLTFEGEGHTAYGENRCVNEAVEEFFISGTTPEDGARCS